eukprot:TRINITY_DN1311_c0_g2_i2.p1 TRINITY_DN1311_c0_g2~~TRINITY_DN1311_c0_g2_i2.p1  ORF type:complete len:287 (+),score=69.53 TRINITY_DN1311_c0_g2_i2:92-952(+)
MTKRRKGRGEPKGKQTKTSKFRPQDPFARPEDRIAEAEGRNRAPKDDLDVVNVPLPRGVLSMAPGINAGSPAGPPRGSSSGDDDKRTRRERNRKRKRGSGNGGAASLGGSTEFTATSAATGAAVPAAASAAASAGAPPAKAPKQRPNETSREYSRRVDEWSRAQLRGVSKKMTTENSKQKKKEQRQAKKAKAAEKRSEGIADAQDGLFRAAKRAAFGDDADRPPILSDAAMKSRAKLKQRSLKGDEGKGSEVPGRSNVDKVAELENYASKVREAYAAMKQRRQASR